MRREIKEYAERMRILSKRQTETLNEAYTNLDFYGKCMIVRPTGFGKTYMLVQLINEYAEKYPDKKVLYVYPSKIIMTELYSKASKRGNLDYPMDVLFGEGDINNPKGRVEYITMLAICDYYGGTTQNFRDKAVELRNRIKNGDYSIILFDEMHRCASENFIKFYEDVKGFTGVKGTRLVGVTATPERTFIEENKWLHETMFSNSFISEYNLGSAIEDGILLEPRVYILIKDLNKYIDDARIKNKSYGSRALSFDAFNKNMSKLSMKALKGEELIYKALRESGYDLASNEVEETSMKFIVFFSDTMSMCADGSIHETWFKRAFNKVAKEDLGFEKNYRFIFDYVISDAADSYHNREVENFCKLSKDRNYVNDATCLGRTEAGNVRYSTPRTINVIFNVGIITVGYHVDNIAGVILTNKVGSNIQFLQQIGRCFSVKSKKTPILIDVLGNVREDYEPVQKRLVRTGVTTITTPPTGGGDDEIDGVELREIFTQEELEELQTGNIDDSVESLLCRFSRGNSVLQQLYDSIVYQYEVLKMPLYFIAEQNGMRVTKVIYILVKKGVKIHPDDEKLVYAYYDNDANRRYCFKHINSEKADADLRKVAGLTRSAYSLVKKMCKEGK